MIDAPYAAAMRSHEDSMLAADARAERAHDLWGELMHDHNWDCHAHARDWTIENVHDELAGKELILLNALYWFNMPDDLGAEVCKRKAAANRYLSELSASLQEALDVRIDEQLALYDEAARKAEG